MHKSYKPQGFHIVISDGRIRPEESPIETHAPALPQNRAAC